MASIGNTPAARKGEIYGNFKVLAHAMHERGTVKVLDLQTGERTEITVRQLKAQK